MKSIIAKYLIGLFVVFLLTACEGESVDPNITDSLVVPETESPAADSSPDSDYLLITGAGIKGPLAFADVKIFTLDPTFSDFYDKNSPIASTITNEYAEIDGLYVPRDIRPPYILTVGGNNAIDLNTGTAPVISTLITAITEDMLADNRPIYATPLTTLVFYMAAQSANASASADANFFVRQVRDASSQVSRMFAIDQNTNIDVLGSPLVINDSTVTLAAQEEAVHHRAAVEAFAAKLHKLSFFRGDGLQATYYNDLSFTNVALERVDANVNFDWQGGSPDATVNSDVFSARWSGLIEPQYSETYTFYTSTDDGVRLWVDGQLIIDNWTDQGETEFSGTITLTAGNKYPIVMEYYDGYLTAVAKLLWSSASQPKSIISKGNLYSDTDPTLLENITPDILIERLAHDLQSDGVIDNSADGTMIGGIDPTIMNQDSMTLQIPNTSYLVEDIVTLMEEERTLIRTGTSPIFYVDRIAFGNTTAPIEVTVSDPVDNNDPVNWNELISNSSGNIYIVSSRDEFNNAARSAAPGDVITIADGTYQWSNLTIPSSGTEQDPIIYTAQNPGQVVFQNVENLFTLTGSHNIIGGFTINNINDKVFVITGATDNRITDNTINSPGPDAGSWGGYIDIYKQSHRTRFDHNIVDGATSPLRILLDNDAVANGPSQDIRIDNNIFRNAPGNSKSLIQNGQGNPTFPGSSALEVRMLFEHNYIDNYRQNSSLIQVKSSRNIIRYNELKDSKDGLYQRNGDYNEWYGNYIHGSASGYAISIHGAYHKVYNNIIDAPKKLGIYMSRSGDRDSGLGTPVPPTHDNLIAHNTILSYGPCNCGWSTAYGMLLGVLDAEASDPMHDNLIVNNIIIGDTGQLIRYEKGQYSNYLDVVITEDNVDTIDNNIYYATGDAILGSGEQYDLNTSIGNPMLNGYEPTTNSTLVIDKAIDISGYSILYDFSGNLRPGTINDIGAMAYRR